MHATHAYASARTYTRSGDCKGSGATLAGASYNYHYDDKYLICGGIDILLSTRVEHHFTYQLEHSGGKRISIPHIWDTYHHNNNHKKHPNQFHRILFFNFSYSLVTLLFDA
jgi:hypothetical protein